jgi:hypothetical protein
LSHPRRILISITTSAEYDLTMPLRPWSPTATIPLVRVVEDVKICYSPTRR